MYNRIINDIHFYFISNNIKKIILSISGGVDSLFLLHVLLDLQNQYQFDIFLYHANFNMNKNSSSAVDLIKEISNNSNLKLFYDKISIEKNNFECNARVARYKRLKENIL